MRTHCVLAILATAVLLGACAHAAPRAGGDALAANDVPSRAERERTERWVERKRMCRELGVRFDQSGLCW